MTPRGSGIAIGLSTLLILTFAGPAVAVQEVPAACTANVDTRSDALVSARSLETQSVEATAGARGSALHREVTAAFGSAPAKERIADQLRRGMIGTAVNPVTGAATIVATPEYRGTRNLAATQMMTGCFSADDLIEADEILVGRAWHPEAAVASFGFSLRAADSRFHVTFDERYPAAAQALRDRLGDRVLVTLESVGRTGRLNDGQPHFGGSGIREGSGSMYSNICTSTFSVRRNSDGVRGSLTAGHCFANGDDIYSGPQPYGAAWGEYNYPAYDMIGISGPGQTYDNVIHTDSCCPVKRDVVGRDVAYPGDYVCFSGMTTRALCGIYVVSSNSFFCDDDGCTGGLIEATKFGQIIVRNGDSGAPIYTRSGSAAALASGMVIAGTKDGTLAWGEHIQFIEKHLDVTLLTS